MPVHRKKDAQSPYYQWGNEGKKYRYLTGDKKSRDRAKQLAMAEAKTARIGR